MKKLWKTRHFRRAAAAVILTALGLSFSLAGRKTGNARTLTGTEVTETLKEQETPEPASECKVSDSGPLNPAGGTVPAEEETAQLHVYVCGCVKRPEVYVLPEGSRITDAVRAAGGLTEDAAPDALNLAELLKDGEKIRIPSKEEWSAAGDNGAGETSSASAGKASGSRKDGRIDLNTAGPEELMTLPGIGEGKAARIIAWREQNGPFRSPEDLMKIPGIKQATYNELKDRITAE